MITISRRLVAAVVFFAVFLLFFHGPTTSTLLPPSLAPRLGRVRHAPHSRWRARPQQYPVQRFEQLPSGPALPIPRIQFDFPPETAEAKKIREERRAAVRAAFAHSWKGYREHAWLQDEVAPISGGGRATFGGWAATLVDSLDTLWIMDLRAEFDEAVRAVQRIGFNRPGQEILSVFEVTIRYLGGLLAAHDLSGRAALLDKALELGELLYVAFDTENRMPVARWNWTHAAQGGAQSPHPMVIVAEPGSLSLEFTRLAQVSGDHKFYDAVARIMRVFEEQQSRTKLPGLWPLAFNTETGDASQGDTFSLGAMADSLYEYLPKQHLLLGGRVPAYRAMYKTALDTAKEYLFFRPMHPANADVLMSGVVRVAPYGAQNFEAEGQHLVCFAGGMLALAARTFDLDHLTTAGKLTDGCVWAYESVPQGIMPEVFTAIRCEGTCAWDEAGWKRLARERAGDFQGSEDEWIAEARLPKGFVKIDIGAYNIKTKAIESIFYMYRITGDPAWMEKGWTMFEKIVKHTRTDVAHAALTDVTKDPPPQMDSMESFWTAETLKYFYLLFSEPGVVSLDEYVLNTEAHPFKRPVAGKGWL